MEATEAPSLLSRPPGARGIFKDQACRYVTRGGDWALPLKNARPQAKQKPRRERKESQACRVLWLKLGREAQGLWADVRMHSEMSE